MNQYTWNAAPRGKGMLKIVTYGDNHDEAQARAKVIVRDVWKAVFEQSPEHEIVGNLVKVEEGAFGPVINYEPQFVGSIARPEDIAQDIARAAKEVPRNVR
jgi:hypothetical protein